MKDQSKGDDTKDGAKVGAKTPKAEPLRVCNQCGHKVIMLGYDWLCTEKCRCTMSGCVPKRES